MHGGQKPQKQPGRERRHAAESRSLGDGALDSVCPPSARCSVSKQEEAGAVRLCEGHALGIPEPCDCLDSFAGWNSQDQNSQRITSSRQSSCENAPCDLDLPRDTLRSSRKGVCVLSVQSFAAQRAVEETECYPVQLRHQRIIDCTFRYRGFFALPNSFSWSVEGSVDLPSQWCQTASLPNIHMATKTDHLSRI